MRPARVLATLLLLPACGFGFDHGVSGDPGADAGAAPSHAMRAHLVDVLAPHGAASARLVDIDGDGALDLVYMGSDSFVFQLGDGRGNFSTATLGPAIAGATQLGFGDWDGDGNVDFVTAASDQIALWDGSGPGQLTHVASYAATPPVVGVALYVSSYQPVFRTGGPPEVQIISADAQGAALYRIYDGGSGVELYNLAEVATMPATSLNIVTAVGTGSSKVLHLALTDCAPYVCGTGAGAAFGKDVELTSGTAAAFGGSGPSTFIFGRAKGGFAVSPPKAPDVIVSAGLPPIDFIDVGDLDGDGLDDILGGSLSARELVVMSAGTQPGTLVHDATFSLPSDITAMHVDGDVNGDGIADPVITLTDRIEILLSSRE